MSYRPLAKALTTCFHSVLGTEVACGPCDQRLDVFYHIPSDTRCENLGEHRYAICELSPLDLRSIYRPATNKNKSQGTNDMDFILRACGLRRDGDAPPPPPRRLPPSEPVARRLRFRRQVRSPANPLLDLPVDVLEHCARLGELRTFHGLVVVLGHSRRPTAVALKRIVRDDRLSPSPLFRDAREVEMTYTHTPPYSNTTGEREEYCIGDSKLKTSPLHRCLVALTEAAWAGDYEVYDDDDEEIPDGILAARRAAAMQQVGATAVYHGVASIEGTNEDVGGYETVALLSVARREARCLPGAVEPPRVLFAVCTAQSTPGFFGHDGQI